MNVNLIAAVGRRGQLGLGDTLPWHDPEDLKWFKAQTMGGILIAGGRTFDALPALSGDRLLFRFSTGNDPHRMLKMAADLAPDRTIWIIGGARTYEAFMPWVRRSVITHIDYDGPADVFMPLLWSHQP